MTNRNERDVSVHFIAFFFAIAEAREEEIALKQTTNKQMLKTILKEFFCL